VITRRKKKIRLALLMATGAALTGLLAGELLPSRGKQQASARADWVEIGVATDGTKAFVNRLSITDTAPRVVLWQRFVLGTARAQSGAARTVEQLVMYDCGTRTVSTLESRELGRSGTLLRTQRFDSPPEDEVRPGSLPEYIYDAVC
jgi:hypothetical protein